MKSKSLEGSINVSIETSRTSLTKALGGWKVESVTFTWRILCFFECMTFITFYNVSMSHLCRRHLRTSKGHQPSDSGVDLFLFHGRRWWITWICTCMWKRSEPESCLDVESFRMLKGMVFLSVWTSGYKDRPAKLSDEASPYPAVMKHSNVLGMYLRRVMFWGFILPFFFKSLPSIPRNKPQKHFSDCRWLRG